MWNGYRCQLTPLEMAARRRNAPKSTGPRTWAGKFRSSLNSLKGSFCPPWREPLIKVQGGDPRGLRRLHRDLISLLLPQDRYMAERVAELADACWEKVGVLHPLPWDVFLEERLRQAEERIESELGLLIQALSQRARKWRYRLERDLRATVSSRTELRECIESRLPLMAEAARTTRRMHYISAGRRRRIRYIIRKGESWYVVEKKACE